VSEALPPLVRAEHETGAPAQTAPKDSMKRTIGRLYLWFGGWQHIGAPPVADKCVLVAAPHTSTWDLPAMLAFAWVGGMSPRWMGKHTLFTGLQGRALRWLGGIPIDRRAAHNVVLQMAEVFGRSDRLMLAIPVEGTRAHRDYWKSGFYHIAKEAQVPIVLTVLDWGRKEGGIGPTIWPSGDVDRDMDQIRAFYAGRQGRWPEQTSRVRLREEDPPPATPTAGT
jgi:1-acyl-sn-glycerol-3-phosphate acyltransferase